MRRQWFLVGIILLLVPWLVAGCGIAQEQYDAVVADLSQAQEGLQSVKTELAASQSKVSELTSSMEKGKAELEAAKGELTGIKKFYPPRDFSSANELRDWLKTNAVSESPPATTAENLYAQALKIQEDALKEGYIISVDVDSGERADEWYIACVATINGVLWAWGPDSDEPNEVSVILGWGKV